MAARNSGVVTAAENQQLLDISVKGLDSAMEGNRSRSREIRIWSRIRGEIRQMRNQTGESGRGDRHVASRHRGTSPENWLLVNITGDGPRVQRNMEGKNNK
jgi:hypothetical protein